MYYEKQISYRAPGSILVSGDAVNKPLSSHSIVAMSIGKIKTTLLHEETK